MPVTRADGKDGNALPDPRRRRRGISTGILRTKGCASASMRRPNPRLPCDDDCADPPEYTGIVVAAISATSIYRFTLSDGGGHEERTPSRLMYCQRALVPALPMTSRSGRSVAPLSPPFAVVWTLFSRGFTSLDWPSVRGTRSTWSNGCVLQGEIARQDEPPDLWLGPPC